MAADEKQGLAAWHSVVRLPEFPVEARSTALVVIDLTSSKRRATTACAGAFAMTVSAPTSSTT